MPEIRTVLCPVDLTQLSPIAVRTATELCRRFDAKLVLHHNLGQRPPDFLSNRWMWSEECEADEQKKAALESELLTKLVADVPEDVRHEGRISRGPVEDAVLFLARELPADLVVMGSHGPSKPDHRSLTEKIIIRSPCPTLTIGEVHFRKALFSPEASAGEDGGPILVPVDFSKHSAAAVAAGLELAEILGTEVVLLHVPKPRGAARRAEAARARLAELVPGGKRAEIRVDAGVPPRRILACAGEIGAGLIVMPAHGKGPLRRFLFGATTFEILHGAECPVWFVPAAGRESGSSAMAAMLSLA